MKIQLYIFSDYNKSITSEVIIKTIISKLLEKSFDEIDIKKTFNGKPYLNNYSDFYFNISHSKDLFAIALSDNPIGVDIEKKCKPNSSKNLHLIELICKRFFSKAEQAYIFESSINPLNKFYEIWTKKEAYTKFKDQSLINSFNNFCVLENELKQTLNTMENNEFIITIASNYFRNNIKYNYILN